MATHTVQIWHIYLLALWLGTVNAIDNPTRQAFMVELVGREQLPNAVPLIASIGNTARIVGPAIAGITIAVVGLSTAFFINAASFVAVIAAYLAMRPHQLHAQQPLRSRGNVLAQIAEGLTYAARTPEILIVLLLVAVVGTFGYNLTIVIPLVAEFILHTGAAKFGFLTSCLGIGSLIAAVAMAALRRATIGVLFASAAGFTLLFLVLAVSPWFAITSIVLILLGFAAISFTTTANTSLQLFVADRLRGRVMSIYVLLLAGSTPIGSWLTGVLSSLVGVPMTLTIEALACSLGVACTAAWYRMRRKSRPGHGDTMPA